MHIILKSDRTGHNGVLKWIWDMFRDYFWAWNKNNGTGKRKGLGTKNNLQAHGSNDHASARTKNRPKIGVEIRWSYL